MRVFSILWVGLCVCGLAACASQSGPPASDSSANMPSTSTKDPGLGSNSGTTGTSEQVMGLETIFFDFDSYTLGTSSRGTLEQNAQYLRDHPNVRIEVQGNADERGSTEYNLALGQRRAESAKRYLVDLGVSASRIDTISFGEENPAVRGHNETAWAKNRRDDFVTR